MFSYFFGYYTTEQKLEYATKAKADLEAQIKALSAELAVKEEEIAKLRKELSLDALSSTGTGMPAAPLAPLAPGAPAVVVIRSSSSTLAATGDIVSDFALRFHPDMTKEQRDQVMRGIREERHFRITLLPPPTEIQTGFESVMTQLKKLRSLYAGSDI